MRIDLQVHSTYSDGYLTPTQLVKFLASKKIKVASLTDHNTVAGFHEFKHACLKNNIKAVPGIELYVKLKHKKFNLLWYNFDYNHPDLHLMLRDSQKRRKCLIRKGLNALRKIGFSIDVNKTLDKYAHYTPINKVVDDFLSNPKNLARVKKELKTKLIREEDVISKYFRNPEIYSLKNSFIGFERIVKLRKKIGGQLILCHPAKHSYIDKDFLKRLKEMGLDGLEMMSPHHSLGAIMYLQALSRELDFIATGGSDFHRSEGGTYPLQKSWDYFFISNRFLRKINEIIKN